MIDKPKVKIAQSAYDKILLLLKENKTYTALRFSENSGCCREAKLNLSLDNYNTDDIEDTVDELRLLYSLSVAKIFKEIVILYKNNGFLIKTTALHPQIKNCAHCSSKKESCTKNGCGKEKRSIV